MLFARNRKAEAEFERLVSQHQSALRYSLRQLTGWNEALADDIAQEALLKAWQGFANFRAEAKFSTWLYRIAYNQLMQNVRQQRETVALDEEQLAAQPGGTDPTGDDLHRDLARAMAQLSLEQRTALHLALHREMNHNEIAEITGCPLGTVKSHIQRGKARLQELMSDWKEFDHA